MNITKNWLDSEITLLTQNYKNKTYKELAQIFNCKEHQVRRKMQALNLHKNYKNRNVSYFLDNTLDSFYWIGFLLADGAFVSERGNKMLSKISVLLSQKDEEHLKKLTSIIGGRLHSRIITNSFSKNPMVQFSVSDIILIPKICDKFDIKNKKTYNPPDFNSYKFNDDQMLSLIIGFIDGDGTIYKKKGGNYQISIFCHESWKHNLKFINDLIHKVCFSIRENKVSYRGNKAGIYIGKTKILRKLKWFINENNLPVLERKWSDINALEIKSSHTTKSNRKSDGILSKKPVIIEDIHFYSKSEACRYFSCSRDLIETYIKERKNVEQ